MFLGIRDLRFAKGRFALMGSVIAMITLLLVMLTGLTGGLGKQNTALLESLGADRIIFASQGKAEAEISFTSSQVTDQLTQTWATTPGITSAEPLGLTQTKIVGTNTLAASIAGISHNSTLLQTSVGQPLQGQLDLHDNTIVLGQKLAQEAGVSLGDTLTVGSLDLTVTGIVTDTYYSHSPVGWVSTATWQSLTHQQTVQGPDAVLGTVLIAQGNSDYSAHSQTSKSIAATVKESFAGLAAYKSEQSSLLTMQGFLYAISALVTVSFLTVWTIQRTRDIAVLRALGASQSYLLKDSLFQASMILLAGAGLGALLGWGLGTLAQAGVPFDLRPITILGPSAGIIVLGLLGALIAVQRVRTTDPMIALGGN